MRASSTIPPHSLEAEQALLGNALLSPEAMATAAQSVTADDFYVAAHRVIFSAMTRLHGRGGTADIVTVTHELGPLLEQVGGVAFIASLVDIIPSTAAVTSYTKIVRDDAERRRLLALANTLQDRCLKGGSPEELKAIINDYQKTKAPTSGPRFRFMSASEVVANQDPPKWVIKDYLEQETVSAIFGPAESFKSFIGVDMGLSVAADMPWHGRAVTPGPVLYLCGEGRAGVGRRIAAWCKSHNATAAQFFVSNGAAALLEVGSVSEVLAAAKECGQQPALVIIDTLNRNFGPGDENSTQDMTGFIRAVDTIRDTLCCAVLIVHHSGVVATDRARGSSALRAALDFEFQVSRTDGDTIAETAIVLKAAKTKDHDRPPTIAFRPVVVDLGRVDEDLSPVTSIVLESGEAPAKRTVKLSGATRIAMTALKSVLGEDGKAHIDTWRKEAYLRAITVSDKPDAKRQAFNRATKSLLDAGMVETRDDLFWLPGVTVTSVTNRDSVTPCHGIDRDERDTPSLEGVTCHAGRHVMDQDQGEEVILI